MLQRLTLRLFGYLFLNAETDVQAFDFFISFRIICTHLFWQKSLMIHFSTFPTKQKKEQNIINVNFHSFKGYNSVK